jgi:hypothetical protein
MPLGGFRLNSLAKALTTAAGPSLPVLSPGWYTYETALTGEKSTGITHRNIAFVGYTNDLKIIGLVATNDSTDYKLKSFVFDQVNETFSLGNSVTTIVNSATAHRKKLVSPYEYLPGEIKSSYNLFNITMGFASNFNQIENVVVDSAGIVSLSNKTDSQIFNTGTSNRSTDVTYIGQWNSKPGYLLFSRVSSYIEGATVGDTRLYTYNSNNQTFELEAAWNSNATSNRTQVQLLYNSGSGLGYYTNNGNTNEGYFNWWNGTTRFATANISPGLRGPAVVVKRGSTSRIITANETATEVKVYQVTFTSTTPTFTQGSTINLSASGSSILDTWRFVTGWKDDEAFFFYTANGKLYVRELTNSGTTLSAGTAVELLTLTSVTTISDLDVQAVWDGNDQYFIGVYWHTDDALPRDLRTFVVRYVK